MFKEKLEKILLKFYEESNDVTWETEPYDVVYKKAEVKAINAIQALKELNTKLGIWKGVE